MTRKTFKEQIVDSQHPFGPMVAAKLDAEMGGKGKFKIDNLRKLKDKELRKLLLENHMFNFIAAKEIKLNDEVFDVSATPEEFKSNFE